MSPRRRAPLDGQGSLLPERSAPRIPGPGPPPSRRPVDSIRPKEVAGTKINRTTTTRVTVEIDGQAQPIASHDWHNEVYQKGWDRADHTHGDDHAIGPREWAYLNRERATITWVEFRDKPSRLCYRIRLEDVFRLARAEPRPGGERWLVPWDAHDVWGPPDRSKDLPNLGARQALGDTRRPPCTCGHAWGEHLWPQTNRETEAVGPTGECIGPGPDCGCGTYQEGEA